MTAAAKLKNLEAMMLTVMKRQILEQSNERTFAAHVIRVPTNTAAGAHIYHLGITLEDGTPLGLMTSATGEVLRQWKRFSSIEEFLAIVRDRLISIAMYPTTCPLPTVMDMLINQYHLYQKLETETPKSERQRLIAALRSTEGENDLTRDSSKRMMGRHIH